MVRPLQSSFTTLDERRLLAGVYLARLAIANALGVAATVVRTTTSGAPSPVPLVFAVIGIPLVFTAASVLYSRRRPIGPGFLAAQVLHDLALITAAVLLTGGLGSEFALIYVLLIAISGLLLGFRGALLTSFGAVAIYLGIAYSQLRLLGASGEEPVVLPNLSGSVTTVLWGLTLTAVVFVLVGLASGITGRRLRLQRARLVELEEQLANARFDAQDILNTVESGILSIDTHEEIDFINSTARMMLGAPAAADLPERHDHAVEQLYGLLVQALRREREVEYHELSLPDASGRPRAFSVSTTVLYDPTGRKRGAAAIVKDIESFKRLEELARQADRSKAVAELAAGLAHEIQNPLAAIRSAVELLSGDERERGEDARLRDLVVRETDRLTALIGDFKAFSGMTIRDRRRIDLVAVVEDAIEVDRLAARSGPDPFFVGPGGSCQVEGEYNLLKQVCLNLLSNARSAVDGRRDGRIEVRVGGKSLLPELEHAAGEFVALEVRDNGVGIDPLDRARIFDPFFTTRAAGFGMGLAVVHRIIDLHGGMVSVESELGRGSTFRVGLPRAD